MPILDAMTSRVSHVVVVGSGGAALMTALVAASSGLRVHVLERTQLLGGTTAISGGGMWIPAHPLMDKDCMSDAMDYLRRLTLGRVDEQLLASFVDTGPEMVQFLLDCTRLELFRVERPDYHPSWQGAREGRSIEPLPFETSALGEHLRQLRYSTTRGPVTSKESRTGVDVLEVEARLQRGVRTQGAALVAGLVEACLDHKVHFALGVRITELTLSNGRCTGVASDDGRQFGATKAVVIASGGFEWNAALVQAHLPAAEIFPTTPPGNEGDGLLMGIRAGAAVDNMSEAWWTAAVQIPGQEYDGMVFTRNIVRELALPGSILVNAEARRFVNEASSYNDLGKAMLNFDVASWSYPNLAPWLIVDERFRRRYPISGSPITENPPPWMASSDTISGLAEAIGLEGAQLAATVDNFNRMASVGRDDDFGRGGDVHGLYYGDPAAQTLNPCLGALLMPPFHAIRIVAGSNGTKGGLVTDRDGRVMSGAEQSIAGLYACGNVAASIMGPGYPGHGGSLGPILTAAYRCGRAIASSAED
ncbi:FAD-dependent oxidoreductase [Devosia sp.]|uniref:FAD-dependent oxidoreductase n=1 Tax=Devosia sp. TaxID=1871048 RepID=UPI0019E77457|nr:FAD-dependent oxidoreductase [Devosia sp.]MBE0579839.1 FAD-dependent oxidoreductase [Devosia sp.]